MGTGSSSLLDDDTPRRLSLTNSPVTRPPRPIRWTPPSPPPPAAAVHRPRPNAVLVQQESIESKQVSEDEKIQAKRKQWDEATAKRVHVVIRTRPLNIKEIKEDRRVRHYSITGVNILSGDPRSLAFSRKKEIKIGPY